MELHEFDGLMLVDKPEGISSFGVIEQIQRSLISKTGLKKKSLPSFGHGGTLDPFATGLLLLCVGRGVKLSRYFLEGGFKTYEAEMKFGEKTASGDCTNPVIETSKTIPTDFSLIEAAAKSFLGKTYLQTPPMYSAKKVDGKRLYELARQGLETKREPRACELRSFEILSLNSEHLKFRVEASSGTFIRTLAEDLAEKLGTLAHLVKLRRVASGPYLLSNAKPLDQWVQSIQDGQFKVSPPSFVGVDHMLDHFPILDVSLDERTWLRTGLQSSIPLVLKKLADTRYQTSPRAALKFGSELVGIAVHAPQGWELERIIPLLDSQTE